MEALRPTRPPDEDAEAPRYNLARPKTPGPGRRPRLLLAAALGLAALVGAVLPGALRFATGAPRGFQEGAATLRADSLPRRFLYRADYDRALEQAQSCAAYDNSKAECHRRLGIVHARAGRTKLAIEEYRAYLQLQPPDTASDVSHLMAEHDYVFMN